MTGSLRLTDDFRISSYIYIYDLVKNRDQKEFVLLEFFYSEKLYNDIYIYIYIYFFFEKVEKREIDSLFGTVV